MNYLTDYLNYNLKIIFVGYNPGVRSALLNQHYAGRGNQFWKLLYDSKIFDKPYKPGEESLLLENGYGLTNLVSRPSKSSSDLTAEEMFEGSIILKEKINKYKPKIVCFLGKEVYRQYSGLKRSQCINYGVIKNADSVIEFVAPNPSGRSTVPYLEKLEVFKELQKLMLKL